MPTRALSARALSGGLCVAGADRNPLLRRPVPPSVAQTHGSEGIQIHKCMALEGEGEAHANARLERTCSERGPLCRRLGPESAVAPSGSAVCGTEFWERNRRSANDRDRVGGGRARAPCQSHPTVDTPPVTPNEGV